MTPLWIKARRRLAILLVWIFVLQACAMGAPTPYQEAKEVTKRLMDGQIWTRKMEEDRVTYDWVSVSELDREELLQANRVLESFYLDHPDRLPAGRAGGRMILRAVRYHLGPNKDPSKALQVRICSIMPKKVDFTWKDKDGKEHRYLWDSWSQEYHDLVERQMRQFADLVFSMSWGKIAVRYKVVSSDIPLTEISPAKRHSYLMTQSNAKAFVREQKFEPNEAMVIFFWVPTEKGFPPHVANAVTWGGSKLNVASFVVYHTSIGRLSDKNRGWCLLSGGMPHEFWHVLCALYREASPGMCSWRVPNGHYRKDFLLYSQEIETQNLPALKYQYEDFYPTLTFNRVCDAVAKKYGTIPGWGDGVAAEPEEEPNHNLETATAFGSETNAEGETKTDVREEAVATSGQGVKARGETDHHLRLWAVTAPLKPGRYRLYVQHAKAGPHGACYLAAWEDLDGDGTPDRPFAVSAEKTVEKDGAWSSWDFAVRHNRLFVGYMWKQEHEYTYYSDKKPSGYQGFGTAMFFGTTFGGKLEESAERYSNMKLIFLSDTESTEKPEPHAEPEKAAPETVPL